MASLKDPGAVLLVSCYELGRQPLALASPAATLRAAGYAPALLDLAQSPLDPEAVRRARFIGISVPMHTALRLGMRAAARMREISPEARQCFYGLYASLNAESLLADGAHAVIGGECEAPLLGLVEALDRGAAGPVAGARTAAHAAGPFLEKIPLLLPDRAALPPLERYVKLDAGGAVVVAGQAEASRGCLHLCRHCPIPPVYGGRFFAVPRDLVLADIAGQIAAGAKHITFGDPDFLNGPGHALRIAEELHDRHPAVTFDFTAKISHLLKHQALLPKLRDCGCLFVVSAVESLSDAVLRILDKGHTRADVLEALRLTDEAGFTLRPTFVPFTPWTTLADYRGLLDFARRHDLVERIDPVQLSIRLLVPPGSLLAGRPEMAPFLGPLDRRRFTYVWAHPDPSMDRLQAEVTALVADAAGSGEEAATTFERVADLAGTIAGVGTMAGDDIPVPPPGRRAKGRPPRLTEPWFC